MLMSSNDRPATLQFGPNGFRVVSPGSHVVCVVTGERIALEVLRYWSVELQEPYSSADAASRRLMGKD